MVYMSAGFVSNQGDLLIGTIFGQCESLDKFEPCFVYVLLQVPKAAPKALLGKPVKSAVTAVQLLIRLSFDSTLSTRHTG